ncbi:DNA modification methyltransferase M.XbaI [Streptococcus pneumoniae]|nr:DNA modification methyltransferase M.XbaI [Streptococcus pneumoniae]CVR88737.1 DNA modification methyltransferase M.XbaI [Streptococcus pneumoniae]CVT10256.1 DNA modification methyltransferase M.XbaI [Streptococcus pneumoniae]CVU61082.1 DNA modification methyltransferase M.XbaI [Streptococcus pneumoniae]CWA93089.1 DNA modification methyltransferase M.XbaI [Streptococcus pneumoniae]
MVFRFGVNNWGLLFDFDTIPENIIVVDHFELTIEKWLSKSQQLL